MNKPLIQVPAPAGLREEKKIPGVFPSENQDEFQPSETNDNDAETEEDAQEQSDKEKEIERTATDSFAGKKQLTEPIQHPCGINW
jgi:hypothetical protein